MGGKFAVYAIVFFRGIKYNITKIIISVRVQVNPRLA